VEYGIDLREALDKSEIVDQTTTQRSNLQASPRPPSGEGRLPWRMPSTIEELSSA
jgi:hypothetical protein